MTPEELRIAYGNKEILITGGLGFIGSSIAYSLVECGASVTLMDSLIPGYGGNQFNIHGIENKVHISHSDVRDQKALEKIVKGQDVIFNMAGTLSHIDSMRDPYTDLDINCRSQLFILEACRQFNPSVKVLFAGTRGQYGRAQYLPVDEKHPQEPTDVNGINNMAGEWYHILYHRIYNIRACSLRLTNTYGPRHQMRHARQGVVNWFVRQILEGQKVHIFGDGSQKRDLNYIDDVVDAFLRAGSSPLADGEVFNLGGTVLGLKDLIETMIRLKGKGSYEQAPFPAECQAVEIGDYVADTTKIRKLLGWEPKVSLEKGLQQTFDYYEKNKMFYW